MGARFLRGDELGAAAHELRRDGAALPRDRERGGGPHGRCRDDAGALALSARLEPLERREERGLVALQRRGGRAHAQLFAEHREEIGGVVAARLVALRELGRRRLARGPRRSERRHDRARRFVAAGSPHVAKEERCARRTVRRDDSEIRLHPQGYYLINPGSVGQSRDGDARASFALFDTAKNTVRVQRVAYDQAACMAKARNADLLRADDVIAPGRIRALRRSKAWLSLVGGRVHSAMRVVRKFLRSG